MFRPPALAAFLVLSCRLAFGADGCPNVPGDFAPYTLDNGTQPPTLVFQGDGNITVADAQALVGVVLGQQQLGSGSSDITIRGTVGSDGTVLMGKGFSVQETDAGKGGTDLPGNVSVTNGSPALLAAAGQSPSFVSQLVPGQIVMIDGQFWTIASITDATHATFNKNYSGTTNSSTACRKDMSLFNSYEVTFDTSFGDPPTVVLTAEGGATPAGSAPSFNLMQLDAFAPNGAVDKSGFRCFFFQGPQGPSLPAGSGSWDFIAIGPP